MCMMILQRSERLHAGRDGAIGTRLAVRRSPRAREQTSGRRRRLRRGRPQRLSRKLCHFPRTFACRFCMLLFIAFSICPFYIELCHYSYPPLSLSLSLHNSKVNSARNEVEVALYAICPVYEGAIGLGDNSFASVTIVATPNNLENSAIRCAVGSFI